MYYTNIKDFPGHDEELRDEDRTGAVLVEMAVIAALVINIVLVIVH